MILLGVDTSAVQGSLALAEVVDHKASNIQQVHWLKKAMHSEVATLELERLLREAGRDLRQVSHLAVNIGPGSFTGLRVGLNLVRTLAYSLNLPVLPVNSLASFAFKLHDQPRQKIFVAMKAVQTFYYAARFEFRDSQLVTELEPSSVDENQLGPLSSGCTKVWIEGQSGTSALQNEAKDLLNIFCGAANIRQFHHWKTVEPLYIRASEAEEKLKKQLLKPV